MKLTDGKIYLDREDVLNIKEEFLPLAVLSRNFYSHFATEIGQFDKSVWNHFMWMIHPGKFVSQDWLFHEVPAEKYLEGKHMLKFWHSPTWAVPDRLSLIADLEACLKQPWYKRSYDFLQLIGIKIGLRKLNLPWLRICSDWADRFKKVDKDFEGKHLTPGESNKWCENRCPPYEVFGRYYPLEND
jgi:hypothetical protein